MTKLVLIHGFAGSPASFRGVEGLLPSEHLRLLRLTLLGHEGPRAGLRPSVRRFEQEVDRLAGVIAERGMHGAHVCGYSLGARVALGLLARHPFLFRSATLIGVHPGLASTRERVARAGQDERWCAWLARGDLNGFATAWESQPIFATRSGCAGAAAHARIRRSHSAEGLARALRILGLAQMPSYRGVLHDLRVPIQLLVGALDQKFVEIGRSLAVSSGRVELHVIAGAGHDLPLEAPARVANVLSRSLKA